MATKKKASKTSKPEGQNVYNVVFKDENTVIVDGVEYTKPKFSLAKALAKCENLGTKIKVKVDDYYDYSLFLTSVDDLTDWEDGEECPFNTCTGIDADGCSIEEECFKSVRIVDGDWIFLDPTIQRLNSNEENIKEFVNLPKQMKVEVILRNGEKETNEIGKFDWSLDTDCPSNSDIIAYRVLAQDVD